MINWGFAGYGRIARKFQSNLEHTNHKIAAIASRSYSGESEEGTRIYNDYEAMFEDPDVDIVYINTTHNTHCELTLKALEAGKHVLCEKPLATSAKDARAMVETAKKSNRFLMEAVWSRFLPAYQKVMELINAGKIGEVEFISAHFGFRMNPDDPKDRLIQPELAAGAVWDVGIYPISLIQDIYHLDPERIQVQAKLSDLDVETRCFTQMTYPDGKAAQISCAVDLTTVNYALISGTKGKIVMEDFWQCERFSIDSESLTQEFHFPVIGTGLYYEAMACAEYLEKGILESPLMSHNHSIQLAKIMDEVIFKARSR